MSYMFPQPRYFYLMKEYCRKKEIEVKRVLLFDLMSKLYDQ